MSAKRRTAVLVPLLVAAACGGERGPAEVVTVRDSAGVRIVTSEAPAWRDDEAWRLSAEPVLRIGELDGAPEYQMERVVGALRRSDGGIVVADAGLRALRFFDAAGRFVRTVGRKGGGPGEFDELASVRLLAGDSLLAFDWRLRGVSVFAPDGSFARSVSVPAGMDAVFPPPHLLGRVGDGSLLVAVGHRYRGGPATGDVRQDSTDFLRYSPAGVLLDTVAVVPSGESFVKTGFGRVGFTTAPLLFGKNSVSGLAADRVIRGDNRAYEIGIYSPLGILERMIRRKLEAGPAPRADFDALVAANLEELDRGWRDRMEQVYAAMPRKSTMPFYSELLVDNAHTPWVRDFSVQHGSGSTWTVFDAGRRMLVGVAMPGRFRPTQIGEGFVLGVRRDELGVESVQTFTLEKSRRGDLRETWNTAATAFR